MSEAEMNEPEAEQSLDSDPPPNTKAKAAALDPLDAAEQPSPSDPPQNT